MAAIDQFWGLPPSGQISVATGPARDWVRLELVSGTGNDGATIVLPALLRPQGEPIATASIGDELVPLAARRPDGGVELGFEPDAAVAALTERRALTARRPLAARMPFHYHRVPAPLRRLIRDAVTARSGSARPDPFPSWPVEPSVEAVRALYLKARQALEPGIEPAPFWPDGKRFALALTHDVDSAAGLQTGARMAAAERERGLSGCWYLVAGDYPLPDALVDALRGPGVEFGLHDAHHDNKIAFVAPGEAGARLDACRDLIERLQIGGFRSPSMLRSESLYEALAGRFAYDSSIPDTGLYPEPNGCATVFPLERDTPRGPVTVLPLSVPPDGQLLGRGLEPEQIVEAWIEKVEWIRGVGGAAVHLTHPDPGFTDTPAMLGAYERFLDWAAAQDDAWHTTPRRIVEHWQARRAAAAVIAGDEAERR